MEDDGSYICVMASQSVKEVTVRNGPELAKPTPTGCGQHFRIGTKMTVGDRPIISNLTAEIIQRPERLVQLLHLGGPCCLRNLFMETGLLQALHCPGQGIVGNPQSGHLEAVWSFVVPGLLILFFGLLRFLIIFFGLFLRHQYQPLRGYFLTFLFFQQGPLQTA